MDKYQVYVPKLLNQKEPMVSGHRACQGCAEVLAVRYVLKALGREIVIANATGCMEIISSAFPSTAWEVPWIHVAFENAAAVGSGVEAGLKALMRKGGSRRSRSRPWPWPATGARPTSACRPSRARWSAGTT